MPDILEFALQYARRGWPVFRLSGAKVPLRGTHGHLDATADQAVIESWWSGRDDLNIGLACGELIILDADGPGGLAALVELARPHGGLPRTLVAQTSRGLHFYYRKPAGAGDLRTLNGPRAQKGDDGFDIKAGGGYVVLPPSLNRKTGVAYRWVEPQEPIAELPSWLVDYIVARGGRREPRAEPIAAVALGGRPAWLGHDNHAELVADIAAAHHYVLRWPIDEVLGYLKRIPASIGNKEWFRVGCMIHSWDRNADGLAIFKAWSKTSTRHDWREAEPECEKEWRNMAKPKPGIEKLEYESLPAEAAKYGPATPPQNIEPVYASAGTANGFHNESQTFETAEGVIRKVVWVDTDEDGNPRPTCTNARVAIRGLGVCCEKDTFHEKLIVGGHAIQRWAGELSDDAVLMMRQLIKEAFRFDPGEKPTRDAAVQLCLANQYDPVVDYLESLQWDGVERLGNWLHAYMAAPDNALTREFARLVLVAAVRRAYRPGAKFDEILVLEGPEGKGKSAALRVMAGEENFSDAKVLGLSDREQFEATGGIWIHEISELNGMRRAEVEHVKAFASRQEDRARPAYGRFRIDRPRRCVFVATTNTNTYLRSDTGDRRFWPVETGRIDVDGLTLARDQLWAEAVARHKNSESIRLDSRWWSEAKKLQTSRQELDAWHDEVSAHVDKKQLRDTSITQVLTEFLRLEISRVGQTEQNRAARVLRMLGFERYQKRDGNSFSWRYRRP